MHGRVIAIRNSATTGTIEKELLRSSRQRLVIVPLTGNDLSRAIEDNNFTEVIETAWRETVFT
jgi:hypothetical protein